MNKLETWKANGAKIVAFVDSEMKDSTNEEKYHAINNAQRTIKDRRPTEKKPETPSVA